MTSAPTILEKNGESSSTHANHTSGFKTIYLPSEPVAPRPCLTTDAAVSQWQQSDGFQAFWGWIKRRCETIKGKDIMRGEYTGSSKGIACLMDMLEKMSQWIETVPPQPQSNQRFGNLAFRTYIKLVEERLPKMFESVSIPPHLAEQLLPLLIQSNAFGHPVRIDYGTGHELAFVLGLWCCVVSGWIGGEGQKEAEEDELILRVFTRYLDLTTQLQQVYRLEPAGSHGVWGLDDYCFLPYLFGSAQLLDSPLTPNGALELSLSHRDTSSSATSQEKIKDLYTLSLHHLTLFKKGAAFSEHSPLLYSLSTMPNWSKPHHGLRKMFLGEVVGKRVVVQGLWIGGWLWSNELPESQVREKAREIGAKNGNPMVTMGGMAESTRAPWAR